MFDRALNTPLSKLYIGPCHTSGMERFCKNSSSNKWIVIWDKVYFGKFWNWPSETRAITKFSKITRVIYPRNLTNQTCCYWFITKNLYLVKFNNRNTRKRGEICSKLTIKTPERRHWRRVSVFINFEHILHLSQLVFLLLTLNK